MARFNAATLEITDLNEVVAMSAFKKGLKQSRFTYSLDKTFPKTYPELLARASKYIRADEGAASRERGMPTISKCIINKMPQQTLAKERAM